jgi:hypothetical protein
LFLCFGHFLHFFANFCKMHYKLYNKRTLVISTFRFIVQAFFEWNKVYLHALKIRLVN